MSLPRRPRHTHARPFLRTLHPFSRTASGGVGLKAVIASATTLLLALGVVAAAASPASAHENQANDWVTLSGEVCANVGYSTENSASHPYVLPATMPAGLPAGGTYSKVIVKAGSTDTGREHYYENTVYAPKEVTGSTVKWVDKATLVAGDSFVHYFKPSISHVIVCAVPETVPVPTHAVQSTGLYLYKKLDPTKNAAWNNSGLQTKIATWDGWSFKTVYPGTLPSDVCGPGWGVQQDEINGPQSLFPTNIEYPNNGGFAAGVLHGSLHLNLTALVTVPDCAPPTGAIKIVTAADPSAQTCVAGALVDGQIHVALNPHVVYKIDGVVTTTEYTTVTPGEHTVTAELADPAGNYVLDGPSSWTFSSDAYGTSCGELQTHPLVTPTVTNSNLTCDAVGTFTLSNTEGVVWTVDGLVKPAGTYQVASTSTVHAVASTVSSDYGFEQGAQTDWSLVFTEPTDCGQLVTHPLVTPVVTSVDRTCTVNGSYTLASVEGVVYTVNGNVQAPGTYPVSTVKTVNVVASTSSSDFGFEAGAQTVWNLVFTDPSNCANLSTLAFTGSNGTLAGGLLVGLIFVLIGAGVITASRLNKRTS